MNRSFRHTFDLTSLFESVTPIGDKRFRALCPDPKHLESRPSCVVNYNSTHGWRWHCFSCGADGDALDVLAGRGLTARAALAVLQVDARGAGDGTRRVGVEPPRAAGYLAGATEAGYFVVCDACRNETAEVGKRRYGGSRSFPQIWSSSADLELACLTGWELSAGLQYVIGPKCLEGARL